MNKEFSYLLRVRYSECDAQKVVFNSRYADYVDLAVAEFTRVIWGDYHELLATGIDMQVIAYSINWKAPAHHDEVLAITVKTAKIGNSSYEFQVEFYNYESREMLATSSIVYVMVSSATHQKMTIPDPMRKPLEAGALGIEIDHAGVTSEQ